MTDPREIAAIVILLIFGTLCLHNLGRDPLWDDEANTGLVGQTVWQTGDTSAMLGRNIIAYRDGLELEGLKQRLVAPLPYYVEAPFVGLLGPSAFAARLPFVMLGLGSLVLVFAALRRENARLQTWILVGLATCGHVSLILYTRQARYYALAVFLTLAISALYLYWVGRRRTIVALSLCALALLATHYLVYVGVAAWIGVDYLLFGRHRRPIAWRHLATMVGFHAVAGGVLIWFRSPFSRPVTGYVPESWIADKQTLFWWYVRDLNAAEFGAGILLVVGPLLYILRGRRNAWLLRLPIAIVVSCLAVTIVSPQPVGFTGFADVRYAIATIPAFIFLSISILEALPLRWAVLRCAVAAVLLLTNVLHVGTAQLSGGSVGPLRSTLMAYVLEITNPRASSYTQAAQLVNVRIAPGESILVLPDFATYPLMFHAPHALYAWQLSAGRRAEYPTLSAIHFNRVAYPTYIIAFGGHVEEARALMREVEPRGIRYVQREQLQVHWPDDLRPELFWRSFEPREFGDPATDGVFVFRREVRR